jgi:hypothetical protein
MAGRAIAGWTATGEGVGAGCVETWVEVRSVEEDCMAAGVGVRAGEEAAQATDSTVNASTAAL